PARRAWIAGRQEARSRGTWRLEERELYRHAVLLLLVCREPSRARRCSGLVRRAGARSGGGAPIRVRARTTQVRRAVLLIRRGPVGPDKPEEGGEANEQVETRGVQ